MAIRFFLWILSKLHHLPFRMVATLGSMIGSLAYVCVRKRRQVAKRNLTLCFPSLSSEEIDQLTRRHFQAVSRSFIERTFAFHAPADKLERVVRLEGLELIERFSDRAIILLFPHFVGLDMGIVRLSMLYQMTGMYSQQKSSAVNDWLLKGRSRFNAPLPISRQEGIRALIRAMQPGRPTCYLPDLDYGAQDSIFVPFLGVQAATITGLSRLARLSKAVVMPVIVDQQSDGYVTRILAPWENFPTKDVVADTLRMNAFIEHEVMLRPEQYYWVHRRFKTRPEGEKSVYE